MVSERDIFTLFVEFLPDDIRVKIAGIEQPQDFVYFMERLTVGFPIVLMELIDERVPKDILRKAKLEFILQLLMQLLEAAEIEIPAFTKVATIIQDSPNKMMH